MKRTLLITVFCFLVLNGWHKPQVIQTGSLYGVKSLITPACLIAVSGFMKRVLFGTTKSNIIQQAEEKMLT
jgi:hypothetical protein